MRVDIRNNDVILLELLSEAAMRAGHTETAIAGFALALRLRVDLGMDGDRLAQKIEDWSRDTIARHSS